MITTALEAAYEEAATTPSDINKHLPTLKAYAARCGHVTEFGVRRGISTVGLLAGLPGMYTGYDVLAAPERLGTLAAGAGIKYTHHRACVLTVDIEPTDLLFIDTLHTYQQLTTELTLHAAKARQFIILHDTTTFANFDEGTSTGPGLARAVADFLSGGEWGLLERHTHNNGLTVLGRGVVA
jgi:hypothetical protein